MKDLIEKLETYSFTDPHGHKLEMAAPWIELKAALSGPDRAQPDAGAEEPVAYQYQYGKDWLPCVHEESYYEKTFGYVTRPLYTRPAAQPPSGEAGAVHMGMAGIEVIDLPVMTAEAVEKVREEATSLQTHLGGFCFGSWEYVLCAKVLRILALLPAQRQEADHG